jgi:hypothetical protein
MLKGGLHDLGVDDERYLKVNSKSTSEKEETQ